MCRFDTLCLFVSSLTWPVVTSIGLDHHVSLSNLGFSFCMTLSFSEAGYEESLKVNFIFFVQFWSNVEFHKNSRHPILFSICNNQSQPWLLRTLQSSLLFSSSAFQGPVKANQLPRLVLAVKVKVAMSQFEIELQPSVFQNNTRMHSGRFETSWHLVNDKVCKVMASLSY